MRWLAVVVLLAACGKEINPRCDHLVEVERRCHQIDSYREGWVVGGCEFALEDDLFVRATEGFNPAGEHEVNCAESTSTCQEYEICTRSYFVGAKKLAVTILAVASGRKEEPPAVCDVYVEKAIGCSPRLSQSAHVKEERERALIECARSFDYIPQNELIAASIARTQHRVSCASSSSTCEAYWQCRNGVAMASAARRSAP